MNQFPELAAFENWFEDWVARHPNDAVVLKQELMSAFFAGINWSRKNESGWIDPYGEYHPGNKPDQDVMDWFTSGGKYGTKPEVVSDEGER